MKSWTDRLPAAVYCRLCNCRSIKADIKTLTDARWAAMRDAGKDKDGFTKEDALVEVLELLESNTQGFDLTQDEYSKLCS